ncbi:hypothetical protein ABZ723_15565 [Streptomyces sp. NPDC006700]|uniref:hypothetical protein n=1 Tax=Streptomyces sp. NPDC006700 TaxID=3154479 RepID=UPI0033FB7738
MPLAAHRYGSVARPGGGCCSASGLQFCIEGERFCGRAELLVGGEISRAAPGEEVETVDGDLRGGFDPPLSVVVVVGSGACVVGGLSGSVTAVHPENKSGRDREQTSCCDGRDHLSDVDHSRHLSVNVYVTYTECDAPHESRLRHRQAQLSRS